MGSVSQEYHRGLLRGTADYCNNNRTWEIHFEQPLPVSKLFELAKSWRADGVIMFCFGMIDNKADPSYVQDIGELSSSLDIPIMASVVTWT